MPHHWKIKSPILKYYTKEINESKDQNMKLNHKIKFFGKQGQLLSSQIRLYKPEKSSQVQPVKSREILTEALKSATLNYMDS